MSIDAGNDSCNTCKNNTDIDDPNFRKHFEDVLDPKPNVRGKKAPVLFDNTAAQFVIKYPRERMVRNSAVKQMPLKPYRIEDLPKLKAFLDQHVEEIQNSNKFQLLRWKCLKHLLTEIGKQNISRYITETNYIKRFKLLLWIEEHNAQKQLQIHNQRGVKLIVAGTASDGTPLYGFNVLGFSDGCPTLILNDRVRIHKINDKFVEDDGNVEKYPVYDSRIKGITKNQDEIHVAAHPTKFGYRPQENVGVEFVLNRRPYQLSHRALDLVRTNPKLFLTLFPKEPENRIELKHDLVFVNTKISKDDKQKQAIECIIGGTSESAPYILIGPPGTGKTVTLVEAIYQLWKRSNSARPPKICISAQSNSAVDVIVKRLLGRDVLEEDYPQLPAGLRDSVIRVYAKTGERDPNLLDCSMNDVDVGKLKAKRIIATTTATAGWLLDRGFGRKWFDYLFIDEAGQSTETDTLIPIAGFMHDKCRLVLAGDPKQLGPVVTSPLAKALQLDVSLMERILSLPIYQFKTNQNSFLLTTTLEKNYRSHPKIIHIPNLRFYHGHLHAEGEARRIFLASDSDWNELSKTIPYRYRYPIIFHGVKGKERNDGSSPSIFNVAEIVEVKNYVEKLLGRVLSGDRPIEQKDIGIISPYKNQVEKIRKYIRHRKWDEIRVGSVESFQGSEKPIIIISTVRSETLGFVKNARRFNVAITRAIALLIVIGHPDVLYTEGTEISPNYWRELIDECYRHRSCKGTLPEELKKN